LNFLLVGLGLLPKDVSEFIKIVVQFSGLGSRKSQILLRGSYFFSKVGVFGQQFLDPLLEHLTLLIVGLNPVSIFIELRGEFRHLGRR
jgi:hypothetical protein